MSKYATLSSMNISNLQSVLEKEPAFRLKQINEAIYKSLIEDWSEAKTLPTNLREKLKKACPLEINSLLRKSKDGGTVKALITLDDGNKIETVLMKHKPSWNASSEVAPRNSVCVSTQIGCPMGCSFCATGKLGLKRSLTKEEIIEQVLLFARILKKTDEKITNITFMGMGEPFLNYDNVLDAIRELNSPNTLGLGARRFSISTCGVIEGINRLADENIEVNLAISLHAPNDVLRTKIMPSNRKYPLAQILRAVDDYYDKTHRKIMFEYVMLEGINDSDTNAEELALILRGKNCMVNLIPYNPTGVFAATKNPQIRHFKSILDKYKIESTQRFEFGQDIDAACGQLANKAN